MIKRLTIALLILPLLIIVLPATPSSTAQAPVITQIAHLGGRGTPGTIIWSPDSAQFATSAYGGVRLYDRTLADVAYLGGIEGTVQPLAWSDDGHTLAGAIVGSPQFGNRTPFNNGNRFFIWQVDDAALLQQLSLPAERISADFDESVLQSEVRARAMAFSPDGSKLAVSSIVQFFTIVSVWDVETGELLAITNSGDFGDGELHFAWSPENTHVAFSALNRVDSDAVLVWDLMEEPTRIEVGDLVTAMAWDGDGLAVTTRDNILMIDSATASVEAVSDVVSGNISPNGLFRAEVERDQFTVTDVNTGEQIFEYTLEAYERFQGPALTSAVWTSQNDLLVTSERGQIFVLVWDGDAQMIAQRFDNPGQIVDTISPSPDGTVAVWAIDISTLNLLDLAQGDIMATRVVNGRPSIGTAIHPSETLVAVGNSGARSDSQSVRVWDWNRERVVLSPPQQNFGFSVDWSPDGQRLAVGATTSGTDPVMEGNGRANVSIWSIDGSAVHQFFVDSVAGDAFFRVKWNQDGSKIAGLLPSNQTGQTRLMVWDVVAGEMLWERIVHGRDFEWLPDGNSIITSAIRDLFEGNFDSFIQTLDATSGELVSEFQVDTVHTTLALHPSEANVLATHSSEGIEIIDLDEGVVVAFIENDIRSPFRPLVWSPDGRLLLADGSREENPFDAKVGVFAVEDNWQLNLQTALSGHYVGPFGIIAIDWRDNYIASYGPAGDIVIWEIANAE